MDAVNACAVCGRPIALRDAEDTKLVLVGADEARPAHWECARTLSLCPSHRQRYLGDRCPRCGGTGGTRLL